MESDRKCTTIPRDAAQAQVKRYVILQPSPGLKSGVCCNRLATISEPAIPPKHAIIPVEPFSVFGMFLSYRARP
jgi:hypothetical protein